MSSNDRLSAAEQGVSPRHSIDGAGFPETSPLLCTDNHQRPSSPQPQSNKRLSNSHLKRSLSDKARKRIIVTLASISGVLLVILGVSLASKVDSLPAQSPPEWTKPVIERPNPTLIKAKNGAVATEEIHCSEIGVQVLVDGGNAVDAAIASCLCIGTVNSFAAGIGGGGFMAIRLPNATVEIIDFRETAPTGSTEDMFKDNSTLAKIGGLAVAVPGEIRGLELAHQRHGELPWERLFAPAIKMAREGWAVGPELARRLQMNKELVEMQPDWLPVFAPEGKALREGEWIKREALADTLEKIAKHGAKAFYEGPIAQSMVDHIKAHGGILTIEDMKNYQPLIREPSVGFYHGRKVYTSPAPTSGPSLISILNILERYNLGKFPDNRNLDTHHVVEAMKFGFAQRTELGDPDFTDLEAKIQSIMSKDTAAAIRANISDKRTFPADHYNPHWATIDNHGTTHLSSVDKRNMAVSLTSTVNLSFGSQLLDPKTGVILNDEMDDFSIPGHPNAFELQPSPHNFPKPGKRPLSSCVPTIVEKDGMFEMSLGGSGGSRILTAVLLTILRVYNYDLNIAAAIDNPRVHHQLLPEKLEIENGYSIMEIGFLKKLGHNVTMVDTVAKAQVQGVMRKSDGYVYAASDTRKYGVAAGY
ncbi:MAG: nucleophile aminohydrolase [Linnemannia gamsii]|nr:MAG: nucleophile aminohydrolase [Linnemannia gamsii]